MKLLSETLPEQSALNGNAAQVLGNATFESLQEFWERVINLPPLSVPVDYSVSFILTLDKYNPIKNTIQLPDDSLIGGRKLSIPFCPNGDKAITPPVTKSNN